LACASSGPAMAAAPTQFIYGLGATFPERAYRDVFNCFGNHDKGTAPDAGTEAGLPNGLHICNTADPLNPGRVAPFPYRAPLEALYIGTGSGRGKTAWMTHDATITAAADST